MALSLNHVQLAGHLTRDPQVKTLATNRAVASFSLAINRRYKTAEGEAKEDVTFVECEAWGRTAELIGQYLVKGSACYIDGRLRLDSWQDKDGQNRQRLKVVAEHVQFIGRPKGQEDAHDDALDEAPAAVVPASPTAQRPAMAGGRAVKARQAVGAAQSDDAPF